MKKILLVPSSVRKNRNADKILALVQAELANFPELDATVFDFANKPLPFFDSEHTTSDPAFAPTDENVKEWTKAVDEADAVIILAAEYNHTFTAVIKNAIDWITGAVWQNKPVAFIGYGWVGGARAITQLRGLLTGFLKANLIETEANLGFKQEIELDGSVINQEGVSSSINAVLKAVEETVS